MKGGTFLVIVFNAFILKGKMDLKFHFLQWTICSTYKHAVLVMCTSDAVIPIVVLSRQQELQAVLERAHVTISQPLQVRQTCNKAMATGLPVNILRVVFQEHFSVSSSSVSDFRAGATVDETVRIISKCSTPARMGACCSEAMQNTYDVNFILAPRNLCLGLSYDVKLKVTFLLSEGQL